MTPKVGWYCTLCCIQDAELIATEERLKEVLSWNEEQIEDGGAPYEFYETLDDLVEDSKQGGVWTAEAEARLRVPCASPNRE
jgi:hypothetical protein